MKDLRNHQVEAQTAIQKAVKGIINLPTGTGKSLIQSRSIVNEIQKDPRTKVYVVMSPRILLSNQLLSETRNDLIENGIDAQYMIVHSGRDNGDLSPEEQVIMEEFDLPFRQLPSSTKYVDIRDTYGKAVREGVPLVISCTYHSADRVRGSGIPVEIIYCDEAHYLVQEQFNWIVSVPFPSERAYYFTATLRETPSSEGMGMNNRELFGDILYQRTPLDMILAGEIVRPRIHIVDMSVNPEGDEADGLAVANAFNEHRLCVNTGAKLLIVAKDGSDHLSAIANHKEIKLLSVVRPSFHLFDISSKHGPRIDGKVVTRKEFLARLRGLTDNDESIIIHHNILTEGIDVPGITGIMPLMSQGKARFLQTLGRATRLHIRDRLRLYVNELKVENLEYFIKKYAYVIIPVYGDFGEDLEAELTGIIDELRHYGFNPSEDIVMSPNRGRRTPAPIRMVTQPTRVVQGLMDFSGKVLHKLEEEDRANALSEFLKEKEAEIDNVDDLRELF